MNLQLDTCAVYTSEMPKPNLLCFSGKGFQAQSPSLALAPPEECTSCSPSPSFLIPFSTPLTREKQEEESQTGTLGSGLRRSPGMILPTETENPSPLDIFSKERVQVTPWKEILEASLVIRAAN